MSVSCPDDLFETLLEGNPNDPLRFNDDDLLQDIVCTLAQTLDDFDGRASDVRNNIFLDTASGDALDARGVVVQTPRESGETDDRYRKRLQAAYSAHMSETTIEEFSNIAKLLLDASANEISVSGAADRPVVIVRAALSVVNDAPFTNQEIVNLLEQSIASAHAIELEESGTFVFDGANYTPPSNTGFGNGTFGTITK